VTRLPTSFRLLTILGIPVRLHLWFVALLAMAFCTVPRALSDGSVALAIGLTTLVLFASVLFHELFHCLAAQRVGGRADEILIWPLGGLAFVRHAHRPGPHTVVAAAGVLGNFILAGLAAAVLAASGRSIPMPGPMDLQERDMLVQLWNVNAVLGALNLLPLYPLDGGSVLQGLLWRRMGYRLATQITLVLGALGGVGMVVAYLGGFSWMFILLGAWVLTRCAGLYMELREGTRKEEEPLFGEYDFSMGYTSLGADRADRRAPSPPAHRPAAAVKSEREAARERLDGLLDRIAREGLQSLSPEDRKFLDEESRRLRSRGR